MQSPAGSMFDLLARTAIVRPHRVLGVAALLLALLLPWAAGVMDDLDTGGFYAPDDSATKAEALLDEEFPGAPANVAVQVVAPTDVDSTTPSRLGRELTDRLVAEPGVAGLTSYWSDDGLNALLRATDGRSALILFRLTGGEDEVQRRLSALHDRYAYDGPGIQVRFGGAPAVMRDVTERSREDLQRAEVITAPAVFAVLLYAFGGFLPALLPVLVGASAVVAGMASLRLIAGMTHISVFSLHLTTALGFALAVDYSLFILRRLAEEEDRGLPRPLALQVSLRTAGRTVLFSGMTVALSLTGALLFPLPYLRSYAYAGITVVLASELAALLLLPAAVMVLGDRLHGKRLHGRTGGHHPQPGRGPSRSLVRRGGRSRGKFWFRTARSVMTRPLLYGCVAVGFMLALATPLRHLDVTLADDTVLPATASSHLASAAMRHDFAVCLPCQIPIVVPGVDAGEQPVADRLADYASELSALPGVARVDTVSGSYADGAHVAPASDGGTVFMGEHGGAWLSLWPADPDPVSDAVKETVRMVQGVPVPYPVHIGGVAPHLLETAQTVIQSLPGAVAVVVAATFVLLFLFTGSVLLPVKALLLNALNLAAVLGVLVVLFQDGWVPGLVGDHQISGAVELTSPVLMFCIAFGLSMDYEIFLLARIREEYQRSGNNRRSVARGLAATGPLLTCAGLALVVVMIGVATSQISIIRMVGIGLALAVVLDITVVRAILVPAFMALAGDYNWWAPAPLRRLHDRFGLREGPDVPADPPDDRAWPEVSPKSRVPAGRQAGRRAELTMPRSGRTTGAGGPDGSEAPATLPVRFQRTGHVREEYVREVREIREVREAYVREAYVATVPRRFRPRQPEQPPPEQRPFEQRRSAQRRSAQRPSESPPSERPEDDAATLDGRRDTDGIWSATGR